MFWLPTKSPSGLNKFPSVLVDLEAVDLVAACQSSVKGSHGIGALGRVFRDIRRDSPGLLQGAFITVSVGQRLNLELLPPPCPTVRTSDRRIDHHHGRADCGTEQFRRPVRPGRRDAVWVGTIEAQDGVHMDGTACLVLDHLGEAQPNMLVQLAHGDSSEPSEVSSDRDGRPSPELGSDRVPQHRGLVVEAAGTDRLAE
jgi:hypothetical protein